MLRVLIASLMAFVLQPCWGTPAFARAMDVGDAAAARKATAAVVNISLWKVRPPATASEAPRRVKVYGSGFVIDSSGIIVTNKHVIDGAIDTEFIRTNFPQAYARKDEDGILNPDHIAEQYWMLHSQPRDAWTHELDLRPWSENW